MGGTIARSIVPPGLLNFFPVTRHCASLRAGLTTIAPPALPAEEQPDGTSIRSVFVNAEWWKLCVFQPRSGDCNVARHEAKRRVEDVN